MCPSYVYQINSNGITCTTVLELVVYLDLRRIHILNLLDIFLRDTIC